MVNGTPRERALVQAQITRRKTCTNARISGANKTALPRQAELILEEDRRAKEKKKLTVPRRTSELEDIAPPSYEAAELVNKLR